MEIENKVKSIIAEQLAIVEPKDTDTLIDDLGMDSLDGVELIMTLEEEYGIEIPDEDTEKIVTVKDTIEYIKKRKKENEA